VPTGEGGGAVPGASGGNVANRDYESVVLANMRRAEERARLVAEMEQEEAEEDGGPS
jgi:DnaJ family protein C protein 17